MKQRSRYIYLVGLIVVFVILLTTGVVAKYPDWIFCGGLLTIFINEILSPSYRRGFKPDEKKYGTNRTFLNIPSGQLLVSSFWEENKSDFILSVPEELETTFHLLNGNPVEMVRSLTIGGTLQDSGNSVRRIKIAVDGGYLLIGDLPFTRSIQKSGHAKNAILRLLEESSDQYHVTITSNEPKDGQAMAFVTGEGDGIYDLKIKQQDQKLTMTMKFMDF